MRSLSIKLLFVFIFVMFLSSSVLAITGAIGNAKMVLSVEPGDTIERSILVINKNNVSVNISLFAMGDLEDEIEIIDKEFVLVPDERKKAWFKVTVNNTGKYETKMNIKFIPSDGKGNGVGLVSNIIINVGGGEELESYDNANNNVDSTDEYGNIVLSGNVIKDKIKNINFSFIIVGIFGLVWLAIFIWLLSIYKKKKRGRLNKKDLKKYG